MKQNIKFHDKKNNIANIDINIYHNKNWKKTLSMIWEYNGSMWQCYYDIIPKNKYQKELMQLWKDYHLNDINWLIYNTLPEDIEEIVNNVVTNIEQIEEKEYATKITLESYNSNDNIKQAILDVSDELGTTEAKLLAICIQCEVTLESLSENNIEVNNNNFTIEWNEWLVCTDEEADDEYLEYVEWLVDDIWFKWLNWVSWPECELVDWEIVVSQSVTFAWSERWSTLNMYNWEEYYEDVLEERIYMYRQ